MSSNQETKACSLTEDEIKSLISHHCRLMDMAMHNTDNAGYYHQIERINYLYKRLIATKKPEAEGSSEAKQPEQTGWGNNA